MEIRDVAYIPPKDGLIPPKLAIRVVRVDSGDTLGVVEVPMPTEEPKRTGGRPGQGRGQSDQSNRTRRPAPAAAEDETEPTLADAERVWRAEEAARLAVAEVQWQEKMDRAIAEARTGSGAQPKPAEQNLGAELSDLRSAVTALQTRLASRDTELAKAQEEIEKTRANRSDNVGAALNDVEKWWKAAEAARMAAAKAEWEEQTRRAVAEARAQAAVPRDGGESPELKGLRSQMEAIQANLSERNNQLAAAQAALAEERTRLQQEAAAALARAEAKARDDVAKAVAESRAPMEAGRDQRDGPELSRLQAELQTLHAKLSERNTELAALQSARTEERTRWQLESSAALAKAEAGEAARVAAAEARANDKDAEIRRISGELAAAKANIAKLNTDLKETESGAREQWQRESEAALAGAEQIWKAAEAARTAAMEVKWKEESARALAQMRDEIEALSSQSEVPRLRAEISSLQATVSKQKSELAEVNHAQLQERAKWQQEYAAVLAETEQRWKGEENARMNAAKEQWQLQTAKAVAEARTTAAAKNDGASAIELRRLQAEFTSVKAALAACEEELRRAQQAKSTPGAAPAAPAPPERIVLTPDRNWKAQRQDLRQDAPREDDGKRRLARDSAIAAALAACVIVFFFPKVQAYFKGPDVAAVTQVAPADGPSAAPSQTPARAPSAPAAPAAPAPKVSTVARTANVHTDPSGVADVVLTVYAGDKVTPVEQRGNWTRVQVTGLDPTAKPQEGWIYTPYLQQ